MSARPQNLLRKTYESLIRRSISDRQWRRILHQYLEVDHGSGDDLSLLPYIHVYAEMRLESPRSPINFAAVQRRKGLLHGFPVTGGSGEDLMFQIQRCFVDRQGRSPSVKTIYAWGYKLGVPLYKQRFYTAEEVWRWLHYLCSQSRWQFNNHSQSLKATSGEK